MSADRMLVVLATLGLVLGLALVWSGLHPGERHIRSISRVDPIPSLIGAIVAVLCYAVSGWAIPAAAAGALVGWALWRRQRPSMAAGDEADRVEALAAWVENVRDVLQAAGQPVGAIGATTESCPPVIRPMVRGLFARISAGQPAVVAFRRFADEIDDPLGDLVATGLLIAVSRGAQTEQVLSALAAQARHQADRRRIVEAERAPMRHQVLMVSLIMCALLGGVFVFARSSYLDAYDTGGGQVFLALILVGYAALLVRVAALSRYPKPSRFLTMGAEP